MAFIDILIAAWEGLIKFKSQILSLYFEIMMIFFFKKYKQTQDFNTYMTIKTHIEYLKPKF